MKARFLIAACALAAVCFAPLGGSSTHARSATATELAAVNRLIELPWAQIADERSAAAEEELRKKLDHKLIDDGGRVAGVRWEVKSTLTPSSADVDIARAPGFTSFSASGFAFRAPLAGSWSFKAGGDLKTTISVGNKSWKPSINLGWRVDNFRVSASAALNPAGTTRNAELRSGSVRVSFSLAGEGAVPLSIPVDLELKFDKTAGGVVATKDVGFPLKIGGGFSASFGGQLRVGLIPVPLGGAIDRELAEEGASVQLFVLTLAGTAGLKVPNVGTLKLSAVRSVLAVPLPLWGDVNGMVQMLQGPQPQRWGERQGRGRTEARAETNWAEPVSTLETGIGAHMPFGAVLSIGRAVVGPPLNTGYDLEADSANFTGHYLAAESLRHAVTPTVDALTRVKETLDGIDRLFWVTEDAVLMNNRYTPVVSAPGAALARTALPTDHPITYRKGALASRGCTYVRPEGGWILTPPNGVPGKPLATLALAIDARNKLGGSIAPNTQSRVWHGWGCGLGRENEPTSRDAYSGVLMGLAYAYHLVADPTVKQHAQRLFEQALDFLLHHKWNVVTAPENKVATEFVGQFHTQLAFLRVGATMNPAKYGGAYELVKPAAAAAWLPSWFSAIDPLSKYFKFNLQTAVLSSALLYETDPALRARYLDAYHVLRRATAHHRNAYFNLVRIFVELPPNRAAVADGPSGSNPDLSLTREIRSSLLEWVDRWREVKNATGMPTSKTTAKAANVQVALYPALVKRYYPLQESDNAGYQAVYALPVWARVGNLDFVWQRSPFGTAFDVRGACKPPLTTQQVQSEACGDRSWREGPGVDYLLAYWLARYLGVVPAS